MQSTNDKLLKNRTILVTGAGSGIGSTTAIALAAQGASVILLGRTVKKLEAVYDAIIDAGSPEPAIYPLDLEGAKPEHYVDLAKNVEQAFGKLDGLLHNAALLGQLTPIEQYPIEHWYKSLQVNLNAPFLLTQAVLPLLHKSADARILFTTAPVAYSGKAYWGAYAVSKAGVANFMEVLADELELNSKIRVNSFNPEAVRTSLRRKIFPGEDPSTLASARDFIPYYVYLLGPASQHLHGQHLDVKALDLPTAVAASV